MRLWEVPRMWAGDTCAILASGPSMTPKVADTVRRAVQVRAIAVNNTYELARWADVLYAADALWWTTPQTRHNGNTNYAHANGFLGLKVCAERTPFADVLHLDQSEQGGSGYGALAKIAVPAGSRRILLCGFDMHGGHWHPKHEAPLRNAGEGIFAKWLPKFEALAPNLAAAGIDVVNVTPNSALRCFRMGNLEEELAGDMCDQAATALSA